MIMRDLDLDYDKPRGWKREELWREKSYRMWKHMWERVTESPYYKDCKIHEKFRVFSNFLKWLENEPRFEEFKATCHETCWCIDKDMKLKGNKNYYPEFMTLCTQSENSKERNIRWGNPWHTENTRKKAGLKTRKPIIGISLVDNSMIIFDSINDAKAKDFNSSSIVNVLKGRQKSHKGYKWYYLFIEKL